MWKMHMIFKELFPNQNQTIIKDHPKYDSILNDPLKLIDEHFQSMHKPIRLTYLYISLEWSLVKITNTRKHEK